MTQEELRKRIILIQSSLDSSRASEWAECIKELDDTYIALSAQYTQLLIKLGGGSDNNYWQAFVVAIRRTYHQRKKDIVYMLRYIDYFYIFEALGDLIKIEHLREIGDERFFSAWTLFLHIEYQYGKMKDILVSLDPEQIRSYLYHTHMPNLLESIKLMNKKELNAFLREVSVCHFSFVLEKIPNIEFIEVEVLKWWCKDEKILRTLHLKYTDLLQFLSAKGQIKLIKVNSDYIPTIKRNLLKSSDLEALYEYFNEVEWDEEIFERIQALESSEKR